MSPNEAFVHQPIMSVSRRPDAVDPLCVLAPLLGLPLAPEPAPLLPPLPLSASLLPLATASPLATALPLRSEFLVLFLLVVNTWLTRFAARRRAREGTTPCNLSPGNVIKAPSIGRTIQPKQRHLSKRLVCEPLPRTAHMHDSVRLHNHQHEHARKIERTRQPDQRTHQPDRQRTRQPAASRLRGACEPEQPQQPCARLFVTLVVSKRDAMTFVEQDVAALAR
jgi:hypothetical protein